MEIRIGKKTPYSPFTEDFGKYESEYLYKKYSPGICYLYALSNIFDNDLFLNLVTSELRTQVIRNYQENVLLKMFFDEIGEEHIYNIEDVAAMAVPPWIQDNQLFHIMNNMLLTLEKDDESMPFLMSVYNSKSGIMEDGKIYDIHDLVGHRVAGYVNRESVYLIDSNKEDVAIIPHDLFLEALDKNYVCVNTISLFFNNKTGMPWIRKNSVLKHIM